jgi:hypothetical protein
MSRTTRMTIWGTVIAGGLFGLAAAAAGALGALRSAWAVRDALRTQPVHHFEVSRETPAA